MQNLHAEGLKDKCDNSLLIANIYRKSLKKQIGDCLQTYGRLIINSYCL